MNMSPSHHRTPEQGHADPSRAAGDHAGQDGHDHEAMIADFRRRFWVSLALTVPILLLSPMIQRFLGLDETARVPGRRLCPVRPRERRLFLGRLAVPQRHRPGADGAASRHDDPDRARDLGRLLLFERGRLRPCRRAILLGARYPHRRHASRPLDRDALGHGRLACAREPGAAAAGDRAAPPAGRQHRGGAGERARAGRSRAGAAGRQGADRWRDREGPIAPQRGHADRRVAAGRARRGRGGDRRRDQRRGRAYPRGAQDRRPDLSRAGHRARPPGPGEPLAHPGRGEPRRAVAHLDRALGRRSDALRLAGARRRGSRSRSSAW